MNDIYGYEQMKSPFEHIDSAFDVFYDEQILVECKDGRKQTLTACVFTDNTGDVLAQDMIDTDREDISIAVRREDWALLQNIEIQDSIHRIVNGKCVKYKVSDVLDDYSMGKVVKARSV